MTRPPTTVLHHVAGGPLGAPVLLLVHPMGTDIAFWDACRAILEKSFRCVAVDLRGAGRSEAAIRPISIEENAADLAAFCDALKLGPVVVVGCAVGAMIATVFAGLRPDLCGGAVLCNPGFRTLPGARTALSARADRARAEGMAAIVPAATDAAFAGCPDDDRKRGYIARFAAQDPDQYALQIEGMLDADTSPWLDGIASPVLIVAGGRDTLLPPAKHAEPLKEIVAGAEYVLVPDGAHFIPYQRPGEFAGLVEGFVRGL